MLYYEEELKALNKNKIKHLVVGGVAVNEKHGGSGAGLDRYRFIETDSKVKR